MPSNPLDPYDRVDADHLRPVRVDGRRLRPSARVLSPAPRHHRLIRGDRPRRGERHRPCRSPHTPRQALDTVAPPSERSGGPRGTTQRPGRPLPRRRVRGSSIHGMWTMRSDCSMAIRVSGDTGSPSSNSPTSSSRASGPRVANSETMSSMPLSFVKRRRRTRRRPHRRPIRVFDEPRYGWATGHLATCTAHGPASPHKSAARSLETTRSAIATLRGLRAVVQDESVADDAAIRSSRRNRQRRQP